MDIIPPLSNAQIESLARNLGDWLTGSDITRLFSERDLNDESGHSTKWKRLYWVFQQTQRDFHCSNRVLDFIEAVMSPARYVGDRYTFDDRRSQINAILSFSGLALGESGKFSRDSVSRTLSEAESRLHTLRLKLKGRQIHPEVVKYCRAELLTDNYFHAVFEACKGLMQRIRNESGVEKDGMQLIDSVFVVDRPLLAFNSLTTESERSEYKGFAQLLKGCHGAVRNPLAHEPKILWDGEEDAVDYLTLVSMLHRKLDKCFRTSFADALLGQVNTPS